MLVLFYCFVSESVGLLQSKAVQEAMNRKQFELAVQLRGRLLSHVIWLYMCYLLVVRLSF